MTSTPGAPATEPAAKKGKGSGYGKGRGEERARVVKFLQDYSRTSGQHTVLLLAARIENGEHW